MKKLIVELVLGIAMGLCIPNAHGAVWTLENDLKLPPEAYILRDLNNGEWRAGYHKRIFSPLVNGRNLFEVGYAQTWDVHHLYPAYGINLNKEVSLSAISSLTSEIMHLPSINVPPWLAYVGDVTGVGANVSYIFSKPNGVKPFVYGFGFTVNLSDVFTVLANGL